MKGARKRQRHFLLFTAIIQHTNLRRLCSRDKQFPLHHISVGDNCVVHNKSNAKMKYACFQLLLFRERVILIFLFFHRHIAADRAIAHAKRALKLQNLFHSNDVASKMSTVKRISFKFISHKILFVLHSLVGIRYWTSTIWTCLLASHLTTFLSFTKENANEAPFLFFYMRIIENYTKQECSGSLDALTSIYSDLHSICSSTAKKHRDRQ